MTETNKRILTATFLIFLLGIILFLGPIAIVLGIFVLSLLAMSELYDMMGVQKNPIIWGTTSFITLLIMLLAFTHNAYIILISLIILFFLPILLFLVLWGVFHVELPFTYYTAMIFALLYIPFMLQFSILLSLQELIFTLLITALSDTGAYIGGRMFGKRLLWPKVSPKKTLEGALCGFLLTLFICSIYAGIYLSYAPLSLLCIITILNIFSQLGDFFESALKRIYNIKDSGSILPGHGGILDRIDSILFVIPIYYIIKIIYIS